MDYIINGKRVIFPEWCKDEKERQGYWGEVLVKSYLELNNYKVIQSSDKFSSWDLMTLCPEAIKESVQVKTMVRFVKFGFWGIKVGGKQSFENLMSSDRLIIVTRNPATYNDPIFPGRIVEIKNHRDYELVGNEYRIPSDKANFTELFKISKNLIDQVNSFKTNQ